MNVKPDPCSFCQGKVDITLGRNLHPYIDHLHTVSFHICRDCDAWVRTKPGTLEAAGPLAKAATRQKQAQLNSRINMLAATNTFDSREQVRKWLAQEFDLQPVEEFNIYALSADQVVEAIELCLDVQI